MCNTNRFAGLLAIIFIISMLPSAAYATLWDSCLNAACARECNKDIPATFGLDAKEYGKGPFPTAKEIQRCYEICANRMPKKARAEADKCEAACTKCAMGQAKGCNDYSDPNYGVCRMIAEKREPVGFYKNYKEKNVIGCPEGAFLPAGEGDCVCAPGTKLDEFGTACLNEAKMKENVAKLLEVIPDKMLLDLIVSNVPKGIADDKIEMIELGRAFSESMTAKKVRDELSKFIFEAFLSDTRTLRQLLKVLPKKDVEDFIIILEIASTETPEGSPAQEKPKIDTPPTKEPEKEAPAKPTPDEKKTEFGPVSVTIPPYVLVKVGTNEKCISSAQCPAYHQCSYKEGASGAVCVLDAVAEQKAKLKEKYLACQKLKCPAGYKCSEVTASGTYADLCVADRGKGCSTDPLYADDTRLEKCQGGEECVSPRCVKLNDAPAKTEEKTTPAPSSVALNAWKCLSGSDCMNNISSKYNCYEVAGAGRICVATAPQNCAKECESDKDVCVTTYETYDQNVAVSYCVRKS